MAYNQISATGVIQPGPDPIGPSRRQITDIIFNSLNKSGYVFRWIQKSSLPYSGELFNGEVNLNLLIYAWRIGNGGRTNLPSEKRIQIPNTVNNVGFDRPTTASDKTLLLGIYDSPSGEPIFAAWDATSNRNHTTKSCQVKVEDLARAIEDKIYQTVDSRDNTIYTFQPEYLGDYIDLLNSGNSLDINPAIEDTDTLIDKVRKSVLPRKKKRTIRSTEDILNSINNLTETEKDVVRKQRVGQGLFKELLLSTREHKCQLCNISREQLLYGSHIKEWSNSIDSEKLDENNGLLLCAHHDALFDKHLISFDDNGTVIISPDITPSEFIDLRLSEIPVLNITDEMKPFLEFHRNKLRR